MHLYVQNKKEIGEYLGSEDSKDTYIEMIVNLATSACEKLLFVTIVHFNTAMFSLVSP